MRLLCGKLVLLALTTVLTLSLCGCSAESEDSVVIYSSAEGVRNEAILEGLHEAFPDYDIRLHYIATGNCAARLKVEGSETEADIILDLEGGYMNQVSNCMEDLSLLDDSKYCRDLIDPNRKYFPFARESACIAVNDKVLEQKGLPVPESYEDLTDPMYKGLICMPNPKSSGTGYNFLKSLVNAWGEDEALAYFDRLSENIYQFTSSGSGPINALVQGEAAIGLGMTFQAVSEINQGVPLSVHFFEEGAPWAVYTMGVIQGRLDDPAVREVFEWLSVEGVKIDNQNYVPDQVLVDYKATIDNYPDNIMYADMQGIADADEKQRLLEKWKY